MDFSAWLLKQGYDEQALTTQQAQHLMAAWQRDTGKVELTREEQIEQLYAEHATQLQGCESNMTRLQAAREQALTEGRSVDWAKLQFIRSHGLQEVRIPGAGTQAPSGFQADVTACSLAINAGVPEREAGKLYGERVMNEAVSSRHRGASFHTIMRAILAQHGEPAPARFTTGTIRRVFELERGRRSGHGDGQIWAGDIGASNFSLAGILSNAANKASLASYSATPTTWQRFCRVVDLNNFKAHTFYRLTGAGTYTQVPPGGEIQHGSLTESEYTLQGDTFGKLLGIDRRDLINDDLGMFAQVPRVLGRMAAVALEKAVYTALLSNAGTPAFFSTDHRNLLSTELPITAEGLDGAYELFRTQVDDNGEPTMIMPTIALVSPQYEMPARRLLSESSIVFQDGSTVESRSPFAGMIEPISSPWLSEAVALHANSSDSRWWLLTGPNDFSVIQVGFVGGNQTPIFESAELDFDRLGMAMRSYHDWGVSLFEWRGGVMSVGTGMLES